MTDLRPPISRGRRRAGRVIEWVGVHACWVCACVATALSFWILMSPSKGRDAELGVGAALFGVALVLTPFVLAGLFCWWLGARLQRRGGRRYRPHE